MKSLIIEMDEGGKINIYPLATSEEEAAKVLAAIEQLVLSNKQAGGEQWTKKLKQS